MKTDIHDPFGEKVSCLERKIAQVSLNRESRYSCCFLRRKNQRVERMVKESRRPLGKGDKITWGKIYAKVPHWSLTSYLRNSSDARA